MTASPRTAADVEKVAEALFHAEGINEPWAKWAMHYRALATAAIEALGLKEETNEHWGDRYTDDHPATRHRYVGPWHDIASNHLSVVNEE